MKVRLLLDENFPAPSVRTLRKAGLDVLSVSESYPGMGDPDVLDIAVEQQRWLATFDLDFGVLLFAKGLPPPPAVLLLRVPSYRADEPATWVMDWVQNQPTTEGMFTVYDGVSLRHRPLLTR